MAVSSRQQDMYRRAQAYALRRIFIPERPKSGFMPRRLFMSLLCHIWKKLIHGDTGKHITGYVGKLLIGMSRKQATIWVVPIQRSLSEASPNSGVTVYAWDSIFEESREESCAF